MTTDHIKQTLIQKLLSIFSLFQPIEPVVVEVHKELTTEEQKIDQIARTVHAANSVLKKMNKEKPETYEEVSEDRKIKMKDAIKVVLEQDTTPKQMHDVWLKNMKELGYKYGSKIDHDKKLHPCMVPYSKLPYAQKAKDDMFRAVILSFKN